MYEALLFLRLGTLFALEIYEWEFWVHLDFIWVNIKIIDLPLTSTKKGENPALFQ